MFQKNVQEKLKLFQAGTGQDKPVQLSSTDFHLIETGDGKADLQIDLPTPCILFNGLEKKKLQYFVNKKCADYLIFENKQDQWFVHILELKRSVGSSEWETIKLQFAGALQNAYALAGVLGIHIDLEHVKVYTVYRNDKLNHVANPAKLRCEIHERDRRADSKEQAEWNAKSVEISFVDVIQLEHHKIKLDIETGEGKYSLTS